MSVLRWDPVRLRLAIDCEAARARFRERRAAQMAKAHPMGIVPVFDAGGI